MNFSLATHKTTIITNVVIEALLFVVMGYHQGFCQNNICTVHTDANGIMTSMTVTNPLTSLLIEKEFNFNVDNQGNPTQGIVKFKNSDYY